MGIKIVNLARHDYTSLASASKSQSRSPYFSKIEALSLLLDRRKLDKSYLSLQSCISLAETKLCHGPS